MLDYQALAALAKVIETQSFQHAASRLFITQSAVSQRIKALEMYYGEPLLIRTLPYQPTPLGKELLTHYRRVLLLEDALEKEILFSAKTPRLSIAINRDSLETWFSHVLEQLSTLFPCLLEIIADDQEITLSYLKNGLASACVSTREEAISGGKSQFLGYLDYILIASPAFCEKYFPGKDLRQELLQAPGLAFDKKDLLHQRYLTHFFAIDATDLPCHLVPSVASFRQFALQGYAYALIPAISVSHEIETKQLKHIFPDKVWQMSLYWHSFSVESPFLKLLNQLVVRVAGEILRQEEKS